VSGAVATTTVNQSAPDWDIFQKRSGVGLAKLKTQNSKLKISFPESAHSVRSSLRPCDRRFSPVRLFVGKRTKIPYTRPAFYPNDISISDFRLKISDCTAFPPARVASFPESKIPNRNF
jgi:hypothetical protein